ncbi:MAG: phosphatase PAP2 family protein [Planctomycetota bacterium]
MLSSEDFNESDPRPFPGYWWWTLALALLAAVCMPFDLHAAQMLHVENLPGDARRVILLSEFFGHGYCTVLCLLGILILVPSKSKFIPRVMFCALLPGFYIQGVKMLIGRTRPIEFHGQLPENVAATFHGIRPGGEWNWEYATQAFMSAHTATAFGLALGLAWLFPRGRWLFLFLAAMTGLQRIAFEAHWLSDVVAGTAVAVMTAGAMTQNWGLGWICGRIERRAIEHAQQNQTDESVEQNHSTNERQAA